MHTDWRLCLKVSWANLNVVLKYVFWFLLAFTVIRRINLFLKTWATRQCIYFSIHCYLSVYVPVLPSYFVCLWTLFLFAGWGAVSKRELTYSLLLFLCSHVFLKSFSFVTSYIHAVICNWINLGTLKKLLILISSYISYHFFVSEFFMSVNLL